MGHSKWNEIDHKVTPAGLERARAELDREITLAELRKARELTQTQLANALEVTQPGVSRIERQADLYVSTLRSYVEALGGRLRISARFDDGEEIQLGAFGDLDRSDENAVPA